MEMQEVWTHLDCAAAATARKFNLNDADREELCSRLKCKLIVAAHTAKINPYIASPETYLCRVIDHELHDWKAERYGVRTEAKDWRDRRILYSPSRYGTVAKMIRAVDFHLACEPLSPEAREVLELRLYKSSNLKEIGRSLGFSKRRVLTLWDEVKRTLSRYYRRQYRPSPRAATPPKSGT